MLAWLSRPAGEPLVRSLESLTGIRHTLAEMAGMLADNLYIPIGWLFILLVLRMVLRKQWLVVAGLAACGFHLSLAGRPLFREQ